MDNIPDVQFSRPPDRTKSELVMSTREKDILITKALSAEDVMHDLKVLLEAATILRRDISSSVPWKFQGSFTDYIRTTIITQDLLQASHTEN